MRSFKKLVLAFCFSLIFISVPAIVSASSAVPSSDQATQEIQQGLCAGSNLDVSGRCTTNHPSQRLTHFVRSVINIFSVVVGVVAVVMIIIGGFRYITSGGNDTGVTGAKNTILYAIIGLVIVAMAQIIIHFVLQRIANG